MNRDLQDIRDLVTGRRLPYHDDEYIRQAAERLLLDRGWPRERIRVEYRHAPRIRGQTFPVRADLVLTTSSGEPAAVVCCRRGSLVSREQETIATARLIHSPALPLAIVTNRDDAELLETSRGRILARGLEEGLPTPERLEELYAAHPPFHPSPDQLDKAARIYRAFAFIQCPGVCRA